MTMSQLLVRGLIAGLLAGLLAFGFARLFGEPTVNAAIDFEAQLAAIHHEPEGPEIVSREIQSTLGLGTGIIVLAVAFGGSFAIAFAFALGRLGTLHARGTALVVALLGFIAVYGVPFLKYPPNPPSIGDPATIQARTALYFGMIAIGILATAGAVRLQRQLAASRGNIDAALIAIVAFAVVVGATMFMLPPVKEVPEGFPPSVLWDFRVASIGTQLVMWLGTGLIFGWLCERAEHRAVEPAHASAAMR